MDRPAKRRRLSDERRLDSSTDDPDVEKGDREPPRSLSHPISPPRRKNKPLESSPVPLKPHADGGPQLAFKSPFQLTKIRDLPPELNAETLSLNDILGDPLISECWEFNYLHDIDFLLSAFDEDVRQLVRVHVVHGFWKREDPTRLALEEQASRHNNVELHAAFMPEMFGTHHSKMLIILRHDDTAQVIIHTANMILRDWSNMTQGVWRSPPLPLLKDAVVDSGDLSPMGSGAKFKVDLISYLRAYDSRRITCKPIANALTKYDFSAIKGALIASVPGRHNVHDDSPTRWGWAAMKQALRSVPIQSGKAEVVVQISSIATLGAKDTWLRQTLFNSLRGGKSTTLSNPNFKVVFPTPDEIRRSLDGYNSGGSIHTKIQSAQQQAQLQYLKPMFCHWANDAPQGAKLGEDAVVQEAGRKRAAPHIKTYIRYGEKSIDWALQTSANLSKQAWGEAENTAGEVRIASWEIGVLVWPSLYGEEASMRVTQMTDCPAEEEREEGSPVVGLRVPYDLPLQKYGPQEKPWVATLPYSEPDWKGQVWTG